MLKLASPVPKDHTFSYNGRTWNVPDLWRAAEGLPVARIPVETVADQLEKSSWFDRGERPTSMDVLMQAQKIFNADLGYPIILAPDGAVMDGLHRIAKAMLLGHYSVPGVTLKDLPPARR